MLGSKKLIGTIMDGRTNALRRMKPALRSLHKPDAHATFAHNLDVSLDLTEETAESLIRLLNFTSARPSILRDRLVAGSLERTFIDTVVRLATTKHFNDGVTVYYPKVPCDRIFSFLGHFYPKHVSASILQRKLFEPEDFLDINREVPFCSNSFGPFYHSEIIEATLDPKVEKFDDCMTGYVEFYRYEILNDLVRRSFITFPADLAYFNEQLRVVALMFSKMDMPAEKSQRLFREALNTVLYGCKEYAQITEVVQKLQSEQEKVSEDLSFISHGIQDYVKNHWPLISQSFVPDPKIFNIHTSFKDKVLNNIRSDRVQGVN